MTDKKVDNGVDVEFLLGAREMLTERLKEPNFNGVQNVTGSTVPIAKPVLKVFLDLEKNKITKPSTRSMLTILRSLRRRIMAPRLWKLYLQG